jgi:hypothetical protein
MKHTLSLLTSAAVISVASQAGAQGYLSIGRNADQEFERKQPLLWTVGAAVGYDSNVALSSNNEEDSGYVTATIGVTYLTGDGRRTAINFNANYSPLYYWDAPPGVEDFQHNARLGFDIRHRVNPRLTITDSFYIAYEVEPDYNIGATVARRLDPYFYGYNSLSAAYSWNRRFSTVSSWVISGVTYDDNSNGDYITNMFAQEFRYAFSRTTTGALTLRFSLTDSDAIGGDYDSFYVLVGADHMFSPRLSGSFRVGAEIRDNDLNVGDETTPYFEGALNYTVSRRTNVRWYAVYGFPTDGSALGDADIRTGLTATHRFDSRFSGNIGLHYVGENGFLGFSEDTFAFSAGLEYVLYKNVSLTGGYSYTTSESDLPTQDYDRHMFQVGVNSRW